MQEEVKYVDWLSQLAVAEHFQLFPDMRLWHERSKPERQGDSEKQ